MSLLEKFFTFCFISTFAVGILATWWRFVPTIVAYYRKTMSKHDRAELTVNG